uniref:S5-locus F-box type-15 protein n=1 Tax=Petunia integrifolia subsp. inflata TaxID=212142 RepID=A0A076YHU9_PETIN|nr:S5-locus F-box type-15 protein [Petunia integrifolia subsp. inflata]
MGDEIVEKLPKDVVIYIFLMVPVKSLVRFKCVSKVWYTLIQSSTFINLHFNRTTVTTKDEYMLVKRSFKEESNRFRSVMSFLSGGLDDDDLYPVSPDLDVPYLTTTNSCTFHRIMGPCNGLIVLTDKITTVLFNPATRSYRLLQPGRFGCPVGFHRSINGVGFGFDSIANSYKIVRIAEVNGEPPFYCYTMREWKVEIYESSVDAWREQDQVYRQLPNVFWYPCFEMFYKGASHWFAHANTMVILCFDMITETFRRMKFPNTCHFQDENCYSLVLLNDSLTLICYPYPEKVVEHEKDFMEIWIMMEYGVDESWIKKYSITPLSIETSLAVWKDHLLLLESRSGSLISYDLNTGEVKQLNLHCWPTSFRIVVYKESLTLIPEEREHSTKCPKILES